MTREEAIRILASSCISGSKQTEALETLIPELRESEDERIRKDIINLIYWLKGNPSLCSQYYKDRYDGILTWLEKQKKQKQEWSESDKQNINLIISYLDSYIKEHNDTFGADECKYLKYWLKSLPLNLKKKNEDIANLCSNEWSEEDSDNLERIDNYLWMLDDYVGDDCTMPQGKTDKIRENIQEILLPWIKSLPERFNPQSKQELSEEETKDLVHILKVLDDCYVYGQHDLSKTDYDNLTSTIKSLKPSWKPSEHQMTILKAVKDYVGKGSGYWGEGLGSLIDDLEKLGVKEEPEYYQHFDPDC